MPAKYTYLLVDIFCILFPFLASFHPRIQFYKQWRYYVLPCLITALFFLLWDVLFVMMGVWRFNEDYLLDVFIYNMPIEEVLFFICIPYACTFTYYCIDKFISFKPDGKALRTTTYVLMLILAAIGFTSFSKAYTATTFSLLALFLLIAMRGSYMKWKPFFISYLVILFPFLLSNGILTGSFIDEPVVIYNNYENLNIRIFTIPVEDAFYAMLLMGMNVYGFERLRSKAGIATKV